MLYRVINAIQQVANNPVIWSVFEMEEGQPVDDSFFMGVGSLVVIGSLLLELFILAVIIVISCFLFRHEQKKKRTCSKKVDARIIDIIEHTNSKGFRTYSVVLEYYVNGAFYTKELSVGADARDMHVGSTYKSLLVNPRNPLEIYEPKPIKIITILVAIPICVIGFLLLQDIFNGFTELIELFEMSKLI